MKIYDINTKERKKVHRKIKAMYCKTKVKKLYGAKPPSKNKY